MQLYINVLCTNIILLRALTRTMSDRQHNNVSIDSLARRQQHTLHRILPLSITSTLV